MVKEEKTEFGRCNCIFHKFLKIKNSIGYVKGKIEHQHRTNNSNIEK